ncbi:uncharacterized protein LOC111697336 [Eurytemora carolleeae]|uniref:uncharacterized protein LOC111697336 n=1 Tax=Eurytemora carolleeae TaxID=1294199 RepID=UPI000C7727E5|nr:uncharacterized protein LOC111697336 [Eurytemora carolleeae]|eukprot:XP_023323071.1 uncharacterized protein LOC111697336 [Eurytemora affinis]
MINILELVKKFQSTVLGGMEDGFCRYGKLVSKYPAVAIIFCLVLTGLCSIGFMFWKEESDGLKLWQPQESEYTKQTIWLKENFPPDTRFCSILLLADNVLQPSVLQQFYLLYEDIVKIPYNDTSTTSFWKTICRKIPGGDCMEFSPLQVFKESDGSYNKENINSLTLAQIQDKINTVWGRTESLFGSVSKTADGKVESAKAMTARFIIYSKNREDESKDFELKLINMVNTRQFKDGVRAYPLTPRSFGDLVGGSISGKM